MFANNNFEPDKYCDAVCFAFLKYWVIWLKLLGFAVCGSSMFFGDGKLWSNVLFLFIILPLRRKEFEWNCLIIK